MRVVVALLCAVAALSTQSLAKTPAMFAEPNERLVQAVLDLNPADADVLRREDVLEKSGDLYAARRFLSEQAAACRDPKVVEKRAFLEDVYGANAAAVYAQRLQTLLENDAAQIEVVDLCRRGLLVSLRDERLDIAKVFAAKLASAGDRTGQNLLERREDAAASALELPGGVDAFNYLIFGGGKTTPDRILVDFARVLLANLPDPHTPYTNSNKSLSPFAERVHDYFRSVAALAALGTRKRDGYEIELTLANKQGRQRTEKVFSILGLKMKSGKEGLALKAAEGKKEAKKQDVVSALAIDESAIQEALAAKKSYRLTVPVDSVPLFPSATFW